MKASVYVFLVAASLVACAYGFPGPRRDSFEDDPDDSLSFDFNFPNYFAETVNKFRHNLMNYFWSVPDLSEIKLPEGANTTSTVKIINGHVVTINETTYSSGDDTSGTAFRIRIIDVKPQNDTILSIGSDADTTTSTQQGGSAESIEDLNNEILKNTDTLTA